MGFILPPCFLLQVKEQVACMKRPYEAGFIQPCFSLECKPKIFLKDGIKTTYEWCKDQ